MRHHDQQQGTPHWDSKRRAEESIGRTAWHAFRPDLTGPVQFTYEGGRLTAITPLDPTNDTDDTNADTVAKDTPTTTGPVVPAAGIGQGVRDDPRPPPLTPAQQMTAKTAQLRDRLDRMTGGTGGLIL